MCYYPIDILFKDQGLVSCPFPFCLKTRPPSRPWNGSVRSAYGMCSREQEVAEAEAVAAAGSANSPPCAGAGASLSSAGGGAGMLRSSGTGREGGKEQHLTLICGSS